MSGARDINGKTADDTTSIFFCPSSTYKISYTSPWPFPSCRPDFAPANRICVMKLRGTGDFLKTHLRKSYSRIVGKLDEWSNVTASIFMVGFESSQRGGYSKKCAKDRLRENWTTIAYSPVCYLSLSDVFYLDGFHVYNTSLPTRPLKSLWNRRG